MVLGMRRMHGAQYMPGPPTLYQGFECLHKVFE